MWKVLLTGLCLVVGAFSLCPEGEYEHRDEDTQNITCKVCPDGETTGLSKKHTCQRIHKKRNCKAGWYGYKGFGCHPCPIGTVSLPGAIKVQECREPKSNETTPLTDIPPNPKEEPTTGNDSFTSAEEHRPTKKTPLTRDPGPTHHNTATHERKPITRTPTDDAATEVRLTEPPPSGNSAAYIGLVVTLIFILVC